MPNPPLHPVRVSTIEAWYLAAFRKMARRYIRIIEETQRAKYTPATGDRYDAWDRFQADIRGLMTQADLMAAQRLRWKATHRRLVIPSGVSHRMTPEDVVRIMDANPWLSWHMAQTKPIIESRAQAVRQIEEQFVQRRADAFHLQTTGQARPEMFKVPIWRLEMHRRNAINTVANISEQVQLSDPEVGAAFPFAENRSRDDRRVRPTHADMDGFVAVRTHPIWEYIRAPNGFGCRCLWITISFSEAQSRGYLTASGTPKFQIKWPNAKAKSNYENRLFPDPDWQGKRYVAP
jgi:hypothetical protein